MEFGHVSVVSSPSQAEESEDGVWACICRLGMYLSFGHVSVVWACICRLGMYLSFGHVSVVSSPSHA